MFAAAARRCPFAPLLRRPAPKNARFVPTRAMGQITENVGFDSIAREMRCKWSADNDKASLSALQGVLEKHLPALKAVKGSKGVQRVVCGGCLDFKIITTLDADSFGAWEGANFEPEASILAEMKAIDGVSLVETQTFTLMPM